MSDENSYRGFHPCKVAGEVARLAIAAFDGQVGERSALGRLKTRLYIAQLGTLVDITRLQVPPRPPKRQSKGCLFFCQSILAKTVKTPDLLHESSQSGAFCIYAAILTYLQRLLPIFLISGGDKSARPRKKQLRGIILGLHYECGLVPDNGWA